MILFKSKHFDEIFIPSAVTVSLSMLPDSSPQPADLHTPRGISYPRLSQNSLRDRNTPYSYKAESVFFILTENILLLTKPLAQLRGSTLSLIKQKT